MKISAIVPSRGRPHTLTAALTTLNKLESGKNEVSYGVVCDSDDPATIGTAKMLSTHMPVAIKVNERPLSLGWMVNDMADHMPADVYLSLADDTLVLTPGWDEKIAEAWRENPKGVWWWKPHSEQRPVLYAIVSDQWKQAAGRIFTDYFPFWYDDLWLLSVWILAVEGPMLTVDATIMDCPMATTRMRDLRFWHNFYLAMNPMRIKQAKEIAMKLGFPQSRLVGAAVGLPNLSISEALAERLCDTPKEFDESMEKIVENQGDKEPPTAAYLAAKARAELLLKQQAFLGASLGKLGALADSMDGEPLESVY